MKTEIINQDYDYTFLADLLELVRGNCSIIHTDKTLHSLFMDVINYVNSLLPSVDGEIVNFDVSVTIKI